jgi:hypothetical protein
MRIADNFISRLTTKAETNYGKNFLIKFTKMNSFPEDITDNNRIYDSINVLICRLIFGYL